MTKRTFRAWAVLTPKWYGPVGDELEPCDWGWPIFSTRDEVARWKNTTGQGRLVRVTIQVDDKPRKKGKP